MVMIEKAKMDELRNLVLLLHNAGMEMYEGSKLVIEAVKLSKKKRISVITALKTIKESNANLNSAMEKISESELTEWETLFA